MIHDRGHHGHFSQLFLQAMGLILTLLPLSVEATSPAERIGDQIPVPSASQSSPGAERLPSLQWSVFIDAYAAYDFSNPPSGDRAFTTQAARANEFNINLAHVEAQFEEPDYRGRLALQAGTSVERNYESEPWMGSLGGPDLAQHLQEARLGYSLSEETWLDAGVFFSHLGSEGWISSENLTLTRSLVADYSPYYLSGLRLTHRFNERLLIKFLVVNGWQIIGENNTDKSFGGSVEYLFGQFSFAYNNMWGLEISPDLNGLARTGRFRHFHNLILRSQTERRWDWILQVDIGFQDRGLQAGQSQWQGASVMGRFWWSQRSQALSLRAEYFSDPDQIVIVTGSVSPFRAVGLSVGYDRVLAKSLFWRTELRSLFADEAVFPVQGNSWQNEQINLTSSLAFKF